MFKLILTMLLIVSIGLISFNYGQLTAYPTELRGMHQTKCDDINYNPRAEQKLVCEVFIQAEDDNIIIYKGDNIENKN